jgi:hypothetical protein
VLFSRNKHKFPSTNHPEPFIPITLSFSFNYKLLLKKKKKKLGRLLMASLNGFHQQ